MVCSDDDRVITSSARPCPLGLGDRSESLFCGRLPSYRKAHGTVRLWSGGDIQATSGHVSPVTRLLPKQAMSSPRIPYPPGFGHREGQVDMLEYSAVTPMRADSAGARRHLPHLPAIRDPAPSRPRPPSEQPNGQAHCAPGGRGVPLLPAPAYQPGHV